MGVHKGSYFVEVGLCNNLELFGLFLYVHNVDRILGLFIIGLYNRTRYFHILLRIKLGLGLYKQPRILFIVC